MNPSRLATKATQFAIALVGVSLSLRFVMRLLNADATSRLVDWIYDTTQPAVQPFFDLFPQVRGGDGFIVEFATLFALVTYVFLGFVVLAVVANNRSKVNSLAPGTKRWFNISLNR